MGIIISTLDYPDEFKRKLLNEEKHLSSLGINFIVDENKKKDYTLFEIDSEQQGYLTNVKRSLADIVAAVVVDELEDEIIEKIIKEDYNDYNLQEQDQIAHFTRKHLDKRNEKINKIIRKKQIIGQLLKYFDDHTDLNIEGFVRFRLKDYMEDLKLAVEKAVDDYALEKEYNEFIELLRYFVELQEPKEPYVNVFRIEDDSFEILDKDENIISNDYLESYFLEMMGEEVEFEDLLLSALISVSPAKIILHFVDKDVEDAVKEIFGDRVKICSGCKLCENYQRK